MEQSLITNSHILLCVLDYISKYAAQQIYTPEQWREKKDFAMEQVLKGLEQYGIVLDTESVSDAIEAALKEIKTAIDGNWDGSQGDEMAEA